MITHSHPAINETLRVFIGHWGISGRNHRGAGPHDGTEISGDESYQWLPGGFFVQGSWNHDFGSGTHAGITVIGFDAASEKLTAHNFDNLGFARHYRLETDGLRWEISGPKERAVRVFSPDGDSFDEKWQVSDSGNWVPLCELHGKRIGA